MVQHHECQSRWLCCSSVCCVLLCRVVVWLSVWLSVWLGVPYMTPFHSSTDLAVSRANGLVARGTVLVPAGQGCV